MLLFIIFQDIYSCNGSGISIHLMLLFILLVFLRLLSRKQISIHLMLLFIFLQLCLCYHLLTFQYISCYCLSDSVYFASSPSFLFQYISCYCLSFLLFNQSHIHLHFNTSHVTVYLNGKKTPCKINEFQYISCYCLSQSSSVHSLPDSISIHLMLLFISGNYWKLVHGSGFQYISCYCLSQPPRHLHYQLRNFNTSHVTVYQFLPVMYNNDRTFQYISCYCLSSRRRLFNSSSAISIHLMLLFIGMNPNDIINKIKISIHLMLLFINKSECIIYRNKRFQYISCYCLSNELTPFYIFLRI